MAFQFSPFGNDQFFDNNGLLAVGYKLFTYLAGTTTKTAVYTDVGGTTPHTNPIILNAYGLPPAAVFLDKAKLYKFVLAPPTDTDPPIAPIFTYDNISIGTAGSEGGNLTGGLNFLRSTIASATTPDIFSVAVGNTIDYTGVANCTGFIAAPQAGAQRLVVCAGACSFTAGANLLIDGVATGANFQAVAGDKLLVIAITTTQFRVTPWRSSGAAVTNQFPPMHIQGLIHNPNVGSPSNDIDFSAGSCIDATGLEPMVSTAITKQSNVAWAVGTNAGMLDTGAIANSDYYIWQIKRTDTNVVDKLCSLSSTAPTMPASYTIKRLIGWFKRVAGVNVAWHAYETEGGGLEMTWDSPTLDINLANTLTTARRTDAVKVPQNFSVIANLNAIVQDATAEQQAWIYCPDQTDLAPSKAAAPLSNITSQGTGNIVFPTQLKIRTSSTGTIAARSNLATSDSYLVSTLGFNWARRN